MQVIIYKTNNGGVATCYPSENISIEEVLAKDCPANSNARIVNLEDLPTKYDEFYNAWEMDNISVTVNLTKAKEIKKQKLRFERESLLQAQDVAFQRALESGSDTAAIVAEKQRLRDITLLADQATTLDELKGITL